MFKKLTQMLLMEREPVGIYFANTDAACDMDADPEKRNCVIPLLMKVSEGKTVSMDEKSCNCAGGATGCCFGDGFARWNPSIVKLLSQGMVRMRRRFCRLLPKKVSGSSAPRRWPNNSERPCPIRKKLIPVSCLHP